MTDLQEWYQRMMQLSSPICENCGMGISKFGAGWHGSQAHILPKSKFPSVATCHLNHMVLGMYNCGCHGQYDSSWFNASKMPVFKIAKSRFLLFEHIITSMEERRRIPEIFFQ